MTKREVRKLAQQYIQQGKTQHQTYSAIQRESDISYLEIAEIVKAIPTLETKRKFKTLNNVLIGALIVTIIFELVTGFFASRTINMEWDMIIIILISPLIYLFLLWAVVTFQPNAQRLVGMFSLVIVFPYFQDIGKEPLVFIEFLWLILLTGLGFYLQKKLTPGYISFREKLTTINGEVTMNNVVVFNDCEQKSDL